jgi:type I restriction enzyme M protein
VARAKKKATTKTKTSANVGYEAQLWLMADALRGSMDAGEYKHVVLGLIFLKYISDAFEEQHARLDAERPRAPIRRIRMNTAHSTSSGCRPKRAGRT